MKYDNKNVSKCSYVPADAIRVSTFYEKCNLILNVLYGFSMVIVLSVPIYLKLFFRIFYKAKKSVKGQIVLITGAGNGIGKQIALRMAKEGSRIAVADIDLKAAEDTVTEIRHLFKNIDVNAFYVDVSDPKSIDNLNLEVKGTMGIVDILINNAGLIPFCSIHQLTNEEIERIVRINVSSHFYTIRTFLPGMIATKRGHIVSVSSMAALHAIPQAVVYCSTKSAVHGFIQSLAEELRHNEETKCINITGIYPSFVSTRKDIIDKIDPKLWPIQTAEKTAHLSVEAILRNEFLVTIPQYFAAMATGMSLLPVAVQRLMRDYVMREQEVHAYRS